MVNHVVSKESLPNFTLELAKRIAAKPAFGLRMTKEAVNRSMDIMGQTNAIESVFALHHVAHAVARESGMDVASRPAGELLSKSK
jgi:enoyl-CoA hydratase